MEAVTAKLREPKRADAMDSQKLESDERIIRDYIQSFTLSLVKKRLHGTKRCRLTCTCRMFSTIQRDAYGTITLTFVAVYITVVCVCSDLSLNDFPLPNMTEFISLANSPVVDDMPQTARPVGGPGDELPRNQWYYEYESETQRRQAQRPADGERHRLKFSGGGATNVTVTWLSFVTILVAVDVVWFVHRMARTYSTAKMILYGWNAASEGIDTSCQ